MHALRIFEFVNCMILTFFAWKHHNHKYEGVIIRSYNILASFIILLARTEFTI